MKQRSQDPSPSAEEVTEFTIEIEREAGGRWLAHIPALPGVMVYGATRGEAVGNVQALALHVVADRMEHGEPVPDPLRIEFQAA